MPPELLTLPRREAGGAPETSIPVRTLDTERNCRWKSRELEWFVEAHSLDRFSAIAELVRLSDFDDATHHIERRCDLATSPTSRRSVTIQVERRFRLSDRWRYLRAGYFPHGRLRHELEMSRRLLAAGFNTPEPLVLGDQSWRFGGSWLVLADPESSLPLVDYCEDPAGCHPSERLRMYLGLGRELARLHAAGFWHGRLQSVNVLVLPEARRTAFAFRDLARTVSRRQISFEDRAGELAALLATLSSRSATRGERRAFLQAYIEHAGFAGEDADFSNRVHERTQQLLRRRETWEVREGRHANRATTSQLETVEKGRLWCDADDHDTLQRARLLAFDAVLGTTDGRCLRALDDRENWRLDLPHTGGAKHAYLKKHHIRTWSTRLRARLGANPGASAGRVEATNIARLNRAGIPSMRLIAFGEKLHEDGRLESFVLTEELAGFMQLDHFLRFRFPVRETGQRTDTDLDLLIRNVAHAASQFHRLGYNHRDLYCCHFFIREGSCGGFQVNLIDLQRVQHRTRFRRRWIVKDLAQLAYSAPRERIGCRERIAFLHAYFGVRKLTAEHKRLVRRVLFKQRWMERTLGLHP